MKLSDMCPGVYSDGLTFPLVLGDYRRWVVGGVVMPDVFSGELYLYDKTLLIPLELAL